MRNVSLPEANDVTTPQGVVTWDGRTGEATAVSITSEIQSHLPSQVSGAGGIVGTTGSVDWALGSDVSTTTETPWTSTTPEPGDPLTVDLGRDGVTSRVFTGMIDDTGGSASGGVNSSGITDHIRRLDKPINMRALCAIMPPPTVDGTTNRRNIDLIPTYFVDRALRHCGYYATPPNIAYAVMSAPLQGSTWPEVGTVWSSNRGNTITQNPWWTDAPWGVASKGLSADYRPDLNKWSYAFDGSLSRAMEIVFCAGPTQNTSGRIACQWGTGGELSVSVTSSRSILAQAMFPSAPGVRQTLLTATTAELGRDWQVATVRFTPVEDGKMSVEIRTDKGAAPRRTGSSIPYGVGTQPMSNINCRWEDNAIGGVQIGFPGRAFAAVEHKPTAILTPPTPFLSLNGSPTISTRPVIELLKEWSEAECAAMWLDEDGVFQWRNRTAFTSGSVVWSGTSLDNLLDYEWSHTADGARSGVTVKYQTCGITRATRYRIPVWQGSGQTMEPGDVVEDIIKPDADKAWIGVDTSLAVFQAESSKSAFNLGRDSWAGYVAYDKDGNEHGNTEYVGYNASLEYIATDVWKLTQTWDGHVPTGIDHIKLQTRDGGTALKPQWQGYDLAVLRAQCELTFEDVATTAQVSGAPQWAAELEHDVGWWLQKSGQASPLAWWLAQQTAKPLPVVDEIRIMPEARLQMGDKIRLTDSHKTGVSIVGVINKIRRQEVNGRAEMVVRLIITVITADKPTLAEYDSAFSGAQLSTHDETWGTATLAQFDADPLKR